MKLQTLDDVERLIGGRPRLPTSKVRIDFYLLPEDAEKLKQFAESKGLALSQLVRSVIRDYLAQMTD